jgi:hypothetical protein
MDPRYGCQGVAHNKFISERFRRPVRRWMRPVGGDHSRFAAPMTTP